MQALVDGKCPLVGMKKDTGSVNKAHCFHVFIVQKQTILLFFN